MPPTGTNVKRNRSFLIEYNKLGFVESTKEEEVSTQCIFFPTNLKTLSVKPSGLKRHIAQKHNNLALKPDNFFMVRVRDYESRKMSPNVTKYQIQIFPWSYHLMGWLNSWPIIKKTYTDAEKMIKPSIYSIIKILSGLKQQTCIAKCLYRQIPWKLGPKTWRLISGNN